MLFRSALAAGNAAIVKPSEYAPASSVQVMDAFYTANPDAPRGLKKVTTTL